MTDMKRLNDPVRNQGEAWIGLRNQNDVNRTWLNRKWFWSLPGVEFNDNTNQNKFHLIKQEKTWREAQSYCREHHTDLVSGPTQLNDEEFKTEIEPERNRRVWIGLFRDTWRWSDESSSSFRSWDPEKFKDEGDKCVTVSNGNWSSDECNHTKPFFCYDDKLILIKQEMAWEDALNYCRRNNSHLVSITNPRQQGWVQEKAKQANSTYVWLGLRYSCPLDLWFWVSDNLVCYNNWAPGNKTEDCNIAVAMSARDEHKWFWRSEEEAYNFICARTSD
ncbi:C-type mannose receptor 2-like [Lycodopsis pacificus]